MNYSHLLPFVLLFFTIGSVLIYLIDECKKNIPVNPSKNHHDEKKKKTNDKNIQCSLPVLYCYQLDCSQLCQRTAEPQPSILYRRGGDVLSLHGLISCDISLFCSLIFVCFVSLVK